MEFIQMRTEMFQITFMDIFFRNKKTVIVPMTLEKLFK